MVVGESNVIDNDAKFVVGIGSGEDRKNGLVVKTNGDVHTYGAIYIGSAKK
jgi:hypothetical protein